MPAGEPYSLEFSPAGRRDLKKLPARHANRIRAAILSLQGGPRPRGSRKIVGDPHAYRIRIGDFRVIYDVHDQESVVRVQRIIRRSETTYRRR